VEPVWSIHIRFHWRFRTRFWGWKAAVQLSCGQGTALLLCLEKKKFGEVATDWFSVLTLNRVGSDDTFD
jgi:hypothetical protein